MADILTPVIEFINNTHVLEQIREVQVKELFTNFYFLVPFVGLMGWWLYKQALNSLVCTGLAIGVWWFSGTPYAQGLVVDGEIQIGKIIPVAGVGIGVLLVLAYLFFIRSD